MCPQSVYVIWKSLLSRTFSRYEKILKTVDLSNSSRLLDLAETSVDLDLDVSKSKVSNSRSRSRSRPRLKAATKHQPRDLDLDLDLDHDLVYWTGYTRTGPGSRPVSTFKAKGHSLNIRTFNYLSKYSLLKCESETVSPTAQRQRIQRRFSSTHSRSMSSHIKGQETTTTAVEPFNLKFLDAAAHGNLEDLKALFGACNVNVKSDRGWTALMFAARNGHVPIISALIEKGCDTQSLNASGQTALDIAQFWNHDEAVSILSQHKDSFHSNQTRNYYSLNPLYRASDLRKDAMALQAMKRNGSSKFVLFKSQKPFLLPPEDRGKKYKFALFSCDDFPANLLDKATVVFLGLETWDPSSSAWFAVELKDEECDVHSKVHPKGTFVTPFPATMQMEETHAGLFAEAHSILCWIDRYRFCPTCGNRQEVVEGGYKQVCINENCSSHKGVHNTCYPRVDPSLIMLVVSPDKKMCLLGRQKRFPPKMFSCLAGFMEPGESIEDTCRREVEEESGVKVGKVDYHSSQPWPFPATLMLGCIAYARTDSLAVDKAELEDARWFSRAELAQMLAGKHPDGLFIPPQEAIAHQLIKSRVVSSSANL